ncbi:MAG: glycosyltransferase 87 family protein [Actinomycetota bacterium]
MNEAADRRTLTLFLIGIAALGLAAGYALKSPCASGDWADGKQYRRLCYSDIVPLYGARGLADGRFPYIDADLEYPAGTGLYVGLIAKTSSTLVSFVNANAVGLALMGLGTAALLAAMARDPRRVLLYAIGPPLILYAFHNWDLLAVGMAALGMYAFWRGADGWAGLWLGIGAATKLYPAFILPAFALALWRRDGKLPWRIVATFALGWAALNVPLMAADFAGWKYPWDFQSSRAPNFETSWFMAFRHFSPNYQGLTTWYPTFANVLSGALFVVGTGVLLVLEGRRERVRPYALAFGIVVIFLLTAKVFSPQYALWLLPFFALLRIPLWSYVAFVVTDAAVWIAISGYFLAVQYASGDPTFRLDVTEVAVWARYIVLAILLVQSRRAEELHRDPGPGAAQAAPVPLAS